MWRTHKEGGPMKNEELIKEMDEQRRRQLAAAFAEAINAVAQRTQRSRTSLRKR